MEWTMQRNPNPVTQVRGVAAERLHHSRGGFGEGPI